MIIGSLLTATGGLLSLAQPSEHLNTAGQNYADYFATRNLAVSAVLVLALAARARRVVVVLMLLVALIQLLDALSAALTGRQGLIPIDLSFAFAFVLAARRLQGSRTRRTGSFASPIGVARWRRGR